MSFQRPTMSLYTPEPKKKRCRHKDSHRWTEKQTRVLLELVLEAVRDDPTKFERPTSQLFYKNNCQHDTLGGIDWTTMKGKMRHLKCTYIKALQWREQVGSELFQSDKSHVEARIKTICPFYELLNGIFEPMLPADPIRLTDNDFKKYLPSTANFKAPEYDFSMEATEYDDSEDSAHSIRNNEVTTKIEQESDERSELYEETTSPKPNGNITNQTHRTFFHVTAPVQENSNETYPFKSKLQIENSKLAIERDRLDLDCKSRIDIKTQSRLQLNFEREKLEFEKQKMFEETRIRKYEIDKQFEIKKLEIEKDERLQRLELEYKYNNKANDESDRNNDCFSLSRLKTKNLQNS